MQSQATVAEDQDQVQSIYISVSISMEWNCLYLPQILQYFGVGILCVKSRFHRTWQLCGTWELHEKFHLLNALAMMQTALGQTEWKNIWNGGRGRAANVLNEKPNFSIFGQIDPNDGKNHSQFVIDGFLSMDRNLHHWLLLHNLGLKTGKSNHV